MAKYYVTCGSFRYLTTAADTSGAALWAVHQYLHSQTTMHDVDWSSPDTVDRDDVIEAMLGLPDWIGVSEIGFGRDEAASLETVDVLTEWNQLVLAISRLEALVN
ncbi:MAG: hypothetical protein ACR2NP_20050 [Pirellulaceae bacterium]